MVDFSLFINKFNISKTLNNKGLIYVNNKVKMME